MTKPNIDQLLIESALQPDLCKRLRECPDGVFQDFDLTEREKEILRQPDHRLLPLLGAALARQMKSTSPCEEAPAATPVLPTAIEAHTVPDTLMALTVVPCVLHENGQFKGITYAVWVNPLPEGVDPASLPPPANAVFPGQPLAPLYAVIQITAVQSLDAGGNLGIRLSASLRQSSNMSAPPPPESKGEVEAPPFGSPLDSAEIGAAATAVREAARGEKYDRLVDLLHVLHKGDVR